MANIYVETIDVSGGIESETLDWFEGQSAVKAPALVAFYPPRYAGMAAAWIGEISLDHARELVDSPARRELLRRIVLGDSAVWLLVDSGDADADEAAATVLKTASVTAKEEIGLPEGVLTLTEAEELAESEDGLPYDFDRKNVLGSGIPLTMNFSVLRVGASAAGEGAFREMLYRSDPETAAGTNGPVAYAVFGQGRALGPILGDDIDEDVLLDASYYICGACSCEVKSENPGFDLLMSANWWSLLDGSEMIPEKELPPTSRSSLRARAFSCCPASELGGIISSPSPSFANGCTPTTRPAPRAFRAGTPIPNLAHLGLDDPETQRLWMETYLGQQEMHINEIGGMDVTAFGPMLGF